ncbi:lipopolysaccharide biosynthesis protein [Streptomyces sp. E11-3]|uniref:lipopolysaccharide biosynthesis protein n=1 Tax=Streptomyces sp. E11-3 TaxID=3110112 RepID=UPI00397EBAEA
MTTDAPTRRFSPSTLLTRPTALAKRLPRWWPLPACALLGALTGGLYSVASTPEYTATSYVIAVPTEKSDPSAALGFAQAYGRVATQLAVLGDAQVSAGVPVRTLRSSVRAETSPDAPMVAVSASADEPGKAVRIANAVSQALIVNAGQTKKDTHVQLQRLSRAVKPSAPSSASATVTTLVGASAGGLLGGLVLLVRPRRAPEEATATVPAPAAAAELRGGA